jgi:phage-related protein
VAIWSSDVKLAAEFEPGNSNLKNTGSDSGITLTNNGSCPFSTSVVKYGSASLGSLNTSGQSITTSAVNHTIKTMECWYNVLSTGASRISAVFLVNGLMWYGYLTPSYLFNASPFWQIGPYGGISNDAWHRLQVTFDGSYIELFVDGAKLGQQSTTIQPTNQTWKIGSRNSGEEFQGYIDNFVLATTDYGGAAISFTNPPTVTSIDVTSGTNDGGTQVVITGTGFVTDATVDLGGTAATGVTVDSATSITCTTPAHVNGVVTITVTNTDAGAGSLENGFTYFSSPTITDINPPHGPHGVATAVTITGTEFAASPAVTFGGTTATSIVRVSATEITCVTPTGTTGDVDVVVTNTDTGSVTATDGYKYISIPTIVDISPSFGDVAGSLLVTITGTEFATGAEVDFDGVPATDVTVNSATEIVCYTPGHVAEAVDVQVTNLDSGTVTETNGFTYHNPTMTLTGISPSTASVLGGETLTLTGTLFAEGLDVTIGGVSQLNVVVVNDETISFVTTAQENQGIVDVTITDGVDPLTLPACLTFTAPPYWNAGTIFNKNKLASDGAVLLLLEVSIPGIDETMRLVRNTENITWPTTGGYVWQAFPFNIDDTNESSKGELPIVHVQISNITRIVQSYLEQTNGAAGAEIKIRYVHAQHLDDTTPLWIGTFALMQADCDENNITIQCGPKYSVNVRRPIWRNVKYICPWMYGGTICGAPAATLASFPTCDKSIVNCEERDNASRYGGELSIPGDYYG